MKNILIFILLLISATSYAQILNDNTDVNTANEQPKEGLFWDGTTWVNARAEDNIFSYPFKYFYENDFSANITGTTAFNGGVIAFNSGALRVVGSSSARGVLIGGAKTEGLQYVAKFTLSGVDPVNGVRVAFEWADIIVNPIFDGTHTLYFTEPTDGNGDERLTIVTNGLDTFFISDLSIMEVVANSEFYSKITTDNVVYNEIDTSFLNTGYIWRNDFDRNVSGVSAINGATRTLNNTGGINISSPAGGQVVGFGQGYFTQDTVAFRLCFEVTAITGVMAVAPVWGGSSTAVQKINTVGSYCFDMQRWSNVSNFGLDNVCLYTFDGAPMTATIKHASIQRLGNNVNLGAVRVGEDITVPSTARFKNRLSVIGSGTIVSSDIEGVFYGINTNAGNKWTRRFSPSYLIDEGVSIGNYAYSAHARTTGIGSENVTVGQSSTAIGSGAETYITHGFAAGRGAYLSYYPHQNNLTNFTGGQSPNIVFAERSLQLGNGWYHRSPEPVSNQSRGIVADPSVIELKFFGQDAFDARHPQWLVGTTYATNNVVFNAGSSWFALRASTGVEPTLANTLDWELWQADTQGAAADFNVSGGDIGIYAGRATGTAQSGSVNLYVAEGNNGQNTKDTPKKAMELRSDEALTTGTFLWLLNEATGTMQRMVIDTKPAVSGSNGIIGFSKGYKPE